VRRVSLERLATREVLELWDLQDLPDLRVSLDPMEPRVLPVSRVTRVHKARLALSESREQRALPGHLETPETRDP
jgi:hypothetical protein